VSIEIEVLIETYTVLKEYVPVKERQGAADTLMSVLVDALSDQDLKELAGVDGYLKRSIQEYQTDDEDADDEYDE
jgi:hypothetical protein